jgi:hypothetical protein
MGKYGEGILNSLSWGEDLFPYFASFRDRLLA